MAGIFKDGFRTTIEFYQAADQYASVNTAASAALASLYAYLPPTEVTPVGYDGGGMIDLTNMYSGSVRPRWHKSLKTLTDLSFTAFYSVEAHMRLFVLVDVNCLVRVRFPENSLLQFYGFMNEFRPNSHREGEPPNATCTIIASNINAAGFEVAPSFTIAPAGQVNLGNPSTGLSAAFSWF